MNLGSALRLLYLHNKQSLVRARYDLGRELVVIISSTVLLSLFFYIFYDFLHAKLAEIQSTLREELTQTFLFCVLFLMSLYLGGLLRRLWTSESSWQQFARRCGEHPRTLLLFLSLQTGGLLFFFYGAYWGGVVPLFPLTTPLNFGMWQGMSLLCLSLRFLPIAHRPRPRRTSSRGLAPNRASPRWETLLRWRLYQIFWRNRAARTCLSVSLALSALTSGILFAGWPFVLVVTLTLIASLLVATAIAFQLEDDMHSLWFERQLGCSHEEFVRVYQLLGILLGLGLAVLSLLSLILCRPLGDLASTWKAPVIAALCPLLLASIMFQLDPSRPLLQTMVCGLVGLFLGTAILAHGLSLALIPVFMYYANQYQKGNFYRL